MFDSIFSLFKEPFTEGYTSCTQVTSGCSDCITAKISGTTSPCYWSSQKKQCGSFDDKGYCGKSDPTCCNADPKPPPDVNPMGGCDSTRYGCCPGSKDTAKINEAGTNCDPIGGCVGTEFGCCPDNETAKKDRKGSNCRSLPGMEDNNSNILNDIQSLQTIEKQLFNNLEENTGLTTEQQHKIIEKINDISKMRINLYQTLSGVNNFFQNALTTTKGTLVEQTAAIDIVEKELNNAKKQLRLLEEEKNNKIRIVEINDYYGQKYEEHSYLMKILVIMLVPILILSILLQKGILPEPIFYILVVIIAIVGGIFLSKTLSSILTRDNMNYQAYNWAFDHSSAPTTTSITETDPWASSSDTVSGGAVATCVGDACCLNGLVFDSANNTCVVSTSNTTTTESFETLLNDALTKPAKSGYHKPDVVLGEVHPKSAEIFINYNAF